MAKTTKEIIRDYLVENGFSGLGCEDTYCFCTTDEVMDCDAMNEGCNPAYIYDRDYGDICKDCEHIKKQSCVFWESDKDNDELNSLFLYESKLVKCKIGKMN